jgi:hypothetical protein
MCAQQITFCSCDIREISLHADISLVIYICHQLSPASVARKFPIRHLFVRLATLTESFRDVISTWENYSSGNQPGVRVPPGVRENILRGREGGGGGGT